MLTKKKLNEIFKEVVYSGKPLFRWIDGKTKEGCEIFPNGTMKGFPPHTIALNTHLSMMDL